MRFPVRFLAGLGLGVAVGVMAVAYGPMVGAPATSGGAEPRSASENGQDADARRGARRGGGGGRGRSGGPPVAYGVVEPASVDRTIEAIGASRALQSVAIATEVGGVVEAVNFSAGQRVKAGALLVQIEDDAQQIAMARAEAQFPIARQNADRYRDLEAEAAASALEAEAAINAFEALRADLDGARYAVSQRAITAPFDGVMGLTDVEPGDLVSPGDVIASLDNKDAVIVEFAAPQEVAAGIKVGQPVEARIASGVGDAAAGVVSAIDSRVDPVSRTLRVEARFDNSSGALIPGAVFAVTSTIEGAPALSVPSLAVQWDRTGSFVWTVDADGDVSRAAIRILQRREGVVVAEGDIRAGEAVVVEGSDRVRPGMTLPPPNARGSSIGAAGAASGLE